jgi:hypothetical protein
MYAQLICRGSLMLIFPRTTIGRLITTATIAYWGPLVEVQGGFLLIVYLCAIGGDGSLLCRCIGEATRRNDAVNTYEAAVLLLARIQCQELPLRPSELVWTRTS